MPTGGRTTRHATKHARQAGSRPAAIADLRAKALPQLRRPRCKEGAARTLPGAGRRPAENEYPGPRHKHPGQSERAARPGASRPSLWDIADPRATNIDSLRLGA